MNDEHQPNSLDDLLAVVPGLRKRRSLDAALLRTLLDRQKKQCTWCGQQVAKGRSTWCSDECVEAFKLRCSPGDQIAYVLKRDDGICRICGRDTVVSEHEFKAEWKTRRQEFGGFGSAESKLAEAAMRERYGYGRGQWREVDHDPPVVMGGGLCGVDKLRLLCGQCHAAETARLAKSRSKEKGGR